MGRSPELKKPEPGANPRRSNWDLVKEVRDGPAGDQAPDLLLRTSVTSIGTWSWGVRFSA